MRQTALEMAGGGEGSAPLLPCFDNRSAEEFEFFRKFTRNPLTSPSSIPLYERTDPTTILRQIGREHSNPPELGAWIGPSIEASLARSPVTLQMDIRVGFATFGLLHQCYHSMILPTKSLLESAAPNPQCKSCALPLTLGGSISLARTP